MSGNTAKTTHGELIACPEFTEGDHGSWFLINIREAKIKTEYIND
jgi:hypothetical protein